MTLLADIAVETAHDILREQLVARHGMPLSADGREQEFIIIGMGKLGGRELNVSSDIDLIFVHPRTASTAGPKIIENFEFFTKLGRGIIQALNDITGDGQVFRVDMRLRPNGDSGPLVASFDMLENYFITQGREWERYAWIKARVMTGIRGAELSAIARPFIFRKYLDFGAINAMRDLHAQIRREVARKDMTNNVKLGPGGIREIEFLAQVFQLIRGGRDTRCRSSRPSRCSTNSPSAASSPAKPSANWPPPTTSCAASNTACSISTTPKPTTCPATPPIRRPSPEPWASPPTRPC